MTRQPAADHRSVTGEAVEIDVRVARLGSRVYARLLDLVIQVVLAFTLGAVTTGIGAAGGWDQAESDVAQVIITVVVLIGYPTLMETLARGRTVGKLALGLRVVRDDGGPIRFRHAFARAMVGISAEFPGLLPPLTWFASIGTMLANPDGKRLGDIAAGTMVIHDRTPITWGWVPAMPSALEPWARVLDLTGLPDDLALAIRNYLSRNRSLKEPARTRLGIELTAAVARYVTPPPPPGTEGWAYLATILAERHRRATKRLVVARHATATVWPEATALTGTPTAPVWQPPPPRPPGTGLSVRPRIPD